MKQESESNHDLTLLQQVMNAVRDLLLKNGYTCIQGWMVCQNILLTTFHVNTFKLARVLRTASHVLPWQYTRSEIGCQRGWHRRRWGFKEEWTGQHAQGKASWWNLWSLLNKTQSVCARAMACATRGVQLEVKIFYWNTKQKSIVIVGHPVASDNWIP